MMTVIFGVSAKTKSKGIKSSDGMITVTAESDGLHIKKRHSNLLKRVTIHVQGTDGENLSISTDEKTNDFVYPFVSADKNYKVYLTMVDKNWGNWTRSSDVEITAAGGIGDFRISYKDYVYDNSSTAIVFNDLKIVTPDIIDDTEITYTGLVCYDQIPEKLDYGKSIWSYFKMKDNRLLIGEKNDSFINTSFFVDIETNFFYMGNLYSMKLCNNTGDFFKDIHPVKKITVDNGILVPVFNPAVTDYEVHGTDKALRIIPELVDDVAAPKMIYGLEPVDGSSNTLNFYYKGEDFSYNFTFVKDETFSFDGKEYYQTFYDDFEGKELNLNNWNRCSQEERQPNMPNHGWWNDGCSYLDGNGNLVIEAKQKNGRNISGAIDTKGLFEQSHGYYEIKFKCEDTSGMWYAFWLLGDNSEAKVGNGATDAAEIDIFELIPNENDRASNTFKSTILWDSYGINKKSKESPRLNVKKEFYNKWHVLKFVWGETSYKLWMDDSLLYEMDASKMDVAHFGGMCNGINYMIISSEFGNWGGSLKSDVLPARMYVDYVKVGTDLKN